VRNVKNELGLVAGKCGMGRRTTKSRGNVENFTLTGEWSLGPKVQVESLVNQDGSVINDTSQIVEKFNDHFASVVSAVTVTVLFNKSLSEGSVPTD